MKIENEHFGQAGGEDVDLYTLQNDRGMLVRIITYGGIITHLQVPDREGHPRDVVLGFDELTSYLRGHPYFGTITGRYAGRIAGGRFDLDGHTYELARNDGDNHLHGGLRGFDKVVWEAATRKDPTHVSLILSYLSPHMEEGYPGNLKVRVIYTLMEDNVLEITYEAETDRPTVLNLTNHSYFNLAGAGNIRDHVLQLNADHYTPSDATLIPTGEILPVAGTPMDFTRPAPIGARFDQLTGDPRGYDHNYVINRSAEGLALAARVRDPASGRVMEVRTTEPGVQLYTGNFLDGSLTGKGGRRYERHAGFCLETQHYPDAPHHPNFPSIVLRPGATYRQTTVHRFLAE